MRNLVTMFLVLAATACDVPSPQEVAASAINEILPACQVTVCDAGCFYCATYSPEDVEANGCQIALCGNVEVTQGPPGSDQVVIISHNREAQ